jgi:ferredoxin, 2Fe-2S
MVKLTYIEFDGTVHGAEVPAGLSVMEGAVRNGIPGIDADCGGACSCGTCHVRVDPAWIGRVGPPGPDEAEMLELAIEPGPASRLSCQIRARPELDGLVVHMPRSQR